ncbi:MAG: EboA domain-containing protein [Kitasatospora sp.]|jgi:hypothetical protein|nr:EboA domain-containing protein [Kitasatospora sp.]
MTTTATAPDGLRDTLPPSALAWFDEALARAASAGADRTAGPGGPAAAWEPRFAEAGRRCGPAAADAVRTALLRAARPGPADTARLYRHGSAGERRAVLLALPELDLAPAEGLALVEDALRANDTSLVAAAVGPFAAAHLPAHAWRHAVLKCLFTGVPVAAVAGLADRSRGDGELARMLTDYAAERSAAGRPVPDDVRRVLALTEV